MAVWSDSYFYHRRNFFKETEINSVKKPLTL